MRPYCIVAIAMFVVFPICTSAFAAEYHVKQDGTGHFAMIQAAIDAAVDGDAIVVHPATYYENIHFGGKNVTLRSVAPEDEQVVASTIIDGGRNGSVVTFAGTEDATCVLSGFTITNGVSYLFGGGINGRGALAGVSNCTITGNSAESGGGGPFSSGGGLSQCDGRISDCRISNNSANGLDTYGGGLDSCGGQIVNCTISGNSTHTSGGGLSRCSGPISNCTISGNSAGGGGGLSNCGGKISNCAITGNRASWFAGGGLSACDGTISNCTISGNSSEYEAGGLACGGTISNCTITGNRAGTNGGGLTCGTTIVNCTISGNSAGLSGGGIYICHGTISNCTITGNSADRNGGGAYECYGTITNSIVWANYAPNDLELGKCDAAVITYSCIRDWTAGGQGNLSEDPRFVSGPYGDYYLSSTGAGQDVNSPCIDAGSGTAQSLGLNEFTTRTDGVTDAGIVDVGFHYPTELGSVPEVTTYLNQLEFSAGDVLIGYLELENVGLPALVDIYVGFIFPGGSIFYYDSNDLISTVGGPWRSDILLPAGFRWGPGEILRTPVPGGTAPGTYFFGAGLIPAGQASFISGHSTAFDIR